MTTTSGHHQWAEFIPGATSPGASNTSAVYHLDLHNPQALLVAYARHWQLHNPACNLGLSAAARLEAQVRAAPCFYLRHACRLKRGTPARQWGLTRLLFYTHTGVPLRTRACLLQHRAPARQWGSTRARQLAARAGGDEREAEPPPGVCGATSVDGPFGLAYS